MYSYELFFFYQMTTNNERTTDPKQNRRVCFSFAAYAKAVIGHLKASGVPVADGLSETEFSAIESCYGFVFPPDLRSILREGLPVGTGFPNWRSSSPQQLQILLGVPVSGLLNAVSKRKFWCESWGLQSGNPSESLSVARGVLGRAPVLVPIYRHFYIPSEPNLAGNPVFFVRGGDVRCSGFDLADFFQREEVHFHRKAKDRGDVVDSDWAVTGPAPAWAAKSARRVQVWSDLVETGDTWREKVGVRGAELEGCLKEMGWRLRDAGWREEEVSEMLTGTDGGDDRILEDRTVLKDRKSVMWHVRLLALSLLRAGWSTDDVVYSMGTTQQEVGPKAAVTWNVDPTQNEITMEL